MVLGRTATLVPELGEFVVTRLREMRPDDVEQG
jgi:hypothetical protein